MKRSRGPALRRALSSPALWAWLALSALPPELLSRAFGWSLADPAYLVASLLWWPVDTFGRLEALNILLTRGLGSPGTPGAPTAWRPPRAALGSALAAEVLLSLRAAALALLGLLPCLALLSLLGPDQLLHWGWRLLLLALAGLGLLPTAFYVLRRLLAPLELLRRPLTAGEALDASELRLRGRLTAFLKLAWPWIALSWALDLAGLALPDALALGLALPSLAASVVPIALSEEL